MLRSNLVQTLEFVGRALASNDLVPVWQCFCFNGEEVIAYNDSLGIVAPCKTSGTFALNGKTLLGLLSASRGEKVEFIVGRTNEITIKTGKSVFKLPYHPISEFLFEEPKVRGDVSVPWTELTAKKFEACLSTSSRDLTQEGLMGVCVDKGVLYGCDSDALTRCEWLGKGDNFGPATMPNSFCETLLKVLDCNSEDFLRVSKDWSWARIGNYNIYGRMIANPQQLDHEQLIKDTVKGKLTYAPLPKGLEHALSRARVLADAETAKTVLTVEGGELTLLTATHMGVVKDNLPLPKHPDVEADVSAAIIQRSISLCQEMAITENCVCFRGEGGLFILTSNIGT
jgi:DNA polymerase III sliding clamp (beta) subunit (PCNA family)